MQTNTLVKEMLNMTYMRTLLCELDDILFALMFNKSVKGQNPPGASLAPLSIFLCDVKMTSHPVEWVTYFNCCETDSAQ